MLRFKKDVSLKNYSTMRLGGPAAYVVEIQKRKDVTKAIAWAEKRKLPVVMIGQGSNIVWGDAGFAGLVIVNRIKRFEVFQEEAENFYVTAGAGEVWDNVVAQTVEMNLSGIECLSLVPGTVGATPIQNVGAYGQEIDQTLVSVEAYDRQSGTFVNIPNVDCRFGYRTSRFKTDDKGRFFITAVTFRLKKTTIQPPLYPSLETYLATNHISSLAPQVVRDAVIAIRRSKLPDPKQVPNNGSFFANPIVRDDIFKPLTAKYDSLVHWELPDGTHKLSAAWLLEQSGLKAVRDPQTGMATWPKQPLVVVNEHAKNTADLLAFKELLIERVKQHFGVTLEQEPEFIEVVAKPET